MSLTRTAVFLLVACIVAGQEIPSDVREATIHCDSKEITITITKAYVPDFQLRDLRFSDTSCPEAGGENSTHFIMRVSLVGCGTVSSENNKSIFYSNYVRERPVEKEVINRLSILRIPFTCSYPKEASASLEEMNVSTTKSKVKAINGKGGFNLQMTIFEDESYSEGYGPAEFPLALSLNTPIYIQLAVDSPDDTLSIIADSCYATPTPNPKDVRKYYIIEDSCPSDSTYRPHEGPGNTQRFSFKSFKFVNDEDGQIYLHCKVFVCNKTDPSSPCAQGCINGDGSPTNKRLRRSAVQKAFELDKGPIKFVSEGQEPQQSSAVATSQATTWVFAVMGAVCVLCLLGVIYSRYQLKAVKRAALDRETNV